MVKRWTSRKFITSVTAQLASIAVLLWPSQDSTIVAASESVAALLVLMLSAFGYVRAEASVDRARQRGESSPAS